jgi:hypothetical protein
MREKIYCMELIAARKVLMSSSEVVNIPGIDHLLPAAHRMQYNLQLISLEAADKTGILSHFKFHCSDIPRLVDHLEAQRRIARISYENDYNKFKGVFLQECDEFLRVISHDDCWRQIDSVWDFMMALGPYEGVVMPTDTESKRLLARCHLNFTRWLDGELRLCETNLRRRKDVESTRSQILLMKSGLCEVIRETVNIGLKEKLRGYLDTCEGLFLEVVRLCNELAARDQQFSDIDINSVDIEQLGKHLTFARNQVDINHVGRALSGRGSITDSDHQLIMSNRNRLKAVVSFADVPHETPNTISLESTEDLTLSSHFHQEAEISQTGENMVVLRYKHNHE